MSPTRYHHGNLRQGLVDAAIAVVEAEGAHGLSLRKAARVAGVSHAAPAHHFGDLRGLMAEVARRGWEGVHAAMSQPVEGTRALDQLIQVGSGYVGYAAENAGLFRAMYHPSLGRDPSPDDAHRQAADTALAYVAKTIEACQAEGTVRSGDPDALAVFAWSAVHGAATLFVDRQLPYDAETVARYITRDLYFGLHAADVTAPERK